MRIVDFRFNPHSVQMTNGESFTIFEGYSGGTAALKAEFRFSQDYQLRVGLRDDGNLWKASNWYHLMDEPHYLELDWQAATAPGANDGSLTLWLDGLQRITLSGVDNDTRRMDRVRLGAVAGIDNGTRGAFYFDAFESRRYTYIGP